MAEPFVAEIRLVPYNFAPRGWAFCQGQIIPIRQNTALFSLLGVTFGGDGVTTFALPDLRGRATMHPGQGPGLTPRTLGEVAGSETITLTSTQVPPHTHALQGVVATGTELSPAGAILATPAVNPRFNTLYLASGTTTPMADMIAIAGGNQAHNNMQPYLTLNACIALNGIFPPRG